MSDTIIRVENLGKKYLIKHQQQGSYTALRDVITDKVKSFGKKIISPWNHKQSSTYSTTEEFWALKDISFKVKQGEVIGIIGRNGAGKSTLLKILSRITEPTKGRIRINGRVASLLEVGTGFHPELTGRENIFLNGAILGMGKAEIKRKFDEIVAFAEIERFLDTPVKRYSSGMYVRLAFAVAAHLEPEILLVDEVLAVGDAQFQNKCLGKMKDVGRGGRTVLFVSHNLAAIEGLCSRVFVLNNGGLHLDGDIQTGINSYSSILTEQNPGWSFKERTDRQGSGEMRIVGFKILNADRKSVDIVSTGKCYTFRFEFVSEIDSVQNLDFGFTIRDMKNVNLLRNRTTESGINLPDTIPYHGFIDCVIPKFPLTSGKYGFGFRLLINGVESDYITGDCAAYFDVVSGDYYGTGQITSHAPVVIDHRWEIS